MLDGYIARKFGYESDLGEKLDSAADFVSFSILVFIFIKLYPSVIKANFWFVVIIVDIRMINMLIAKLKYKKVVFIHTYGNKISGVLLFAIPFILLFTRSNIVLRVILTVVTTAAIEELLITIKYKEPNPNRKSIFFE